MSNAKNLETTAENCSRELFSHLLFSFTKLSMTDPACTILLSDYDFTVRIWDNITATQIFTESMKEIGMSGTLDSGNTCIVVKFVDGEEPYVFVSFSKSKKCYANFKDVNSQVYGVEGYHSGSLMIFSPTKIYFKHPKGKFVPSNLKTFGYVPSALKSMIFQFFAKQNLIWQDLGGYLQYPPISLELVSNARNCRDLLQKKFKTELPKSVNKRPFDVMYATCCAERFVLPEQKQFLFSSTIAEVKLAKSTKNMAKNLVKSIICERLAIPEHDGNTCQMISDYVSMAIDGKERIDLLSGKKTYIRLHDEIMVKNRVKQSKIKLAIPSTELSKLKLPSEFVRITTMKALIEESVRNHNCVASYAQQINKGKCLIYAFDSPDGEHCTLEIGMKSGKFCILQFRKAYNREVSPETWTYVSSAINTANESKKSLKTS